jgi:hypothetical protein
MRGAVRMQAGVVVGALVMALAGPVAGAPAATTQLQVLGHSDLGGKGLNGDVAVVGDTAIVGGGLIPDTGYHTERYNPLPCLGTSVKVVDLTDPKTPKVASEIPVPEGIAAIDVAALHVKTPTFTGDLAAIALDDGVSELGPTGCTVNAAHPSPSGVDRGVLFYDVTNRADPKLLGRYMADQGPMDDVPTDGPGCGPPPDGNVNRCAVGQHAVSLAQRADGKVVAVTVELIADFNNRPSGDVRMVDVTDPRKPTQVGSWPPLGQRPGSFSPNGCAPFTNGHSATLSADGNQALVAFLDAGLFALDVTDPAKPVKVAQASFAGDRAEEGNAGFAASFAAGGRQLALESDEGWWPSSTSLVVDSPSALAGTKFACEGLPTLYDPTSESQLYKRPGAKVSADIVYGGRGCPARGANNATAEDPYPSDPRGKIVLLDTFKVNATQPDIATAACNNTVKMRRAQQAGAVAVLFTRVPNAPFSASPQAIAWGGDFNGISIPGTMVDQPDGDALRTALCPRLDGGQCAGGQAAKGSLVDAKGEWGGLRVLDLSDPVAPRVVTTWRPDEATVFPPADLGVYAPGPAAVRGTVAYVTWHAAGLRALDLSGGSPKELGSFVPPPTADPTKNLPTATDVVGVATTSRYVVAVDTSSGLYVLSPVGGSGSSGGGTPAALVVGVGVVVLAVLVGAFVVVRRRRGTAGGAG